MAVEAVAEFFEGARVIGARGTALLLYVISSHLRLYQAFACLPWARNSCVGVRLIEGAALPFLPSVFPG